MGGHQDGQGSSVHSNRCDVLRPRARYGPIAVSLSFTIQSHFDETLYLFPTNAPIEVSDVKRVIFLHIFGHCVIPYQDMARSETPFSLQFVNSDSAFQIKKSCIGLAVAD
jgi:hypothetical protein